MRRILVVGSGGREHTIIWKLAGEGRELFCAPGNGGISDMAVCADIKATDVEGIFSTTSALVKASASPCANSTIFPSIVLPAYVTDGSPMLSLIHI